MAEHTVSAETVLGQLPEHADATVTIRVGTEHWDTGEITLEIAGTGQLTVTQRIAGKVNTYEASVGADRVRAIGAELAALGLTSIRARPGNRQPGDVPVVLAVERGGQRLHSAELWHGDRYEDKALDQLLTRSDALISEVTGGALPFGG